MASHDKEAKDYKDLTPQGKKNRDSANLTRMLKELGLQSVTINDEGDPITRFEQLAEYIWKAALGWIEEIRTGDSVTEIIHKPDKTFIHMIYDRLHGKIPTVALDKGAKHASVADRVSAQTKSRINALSE